MDAVQLDSSALSTEIAIAMLEQDYRDALYVRRDHAEAMRIMNRIRDLKAEAMPGQATPSVIAAAEQAEALRAEAGDIYRNGKGDPVLAATLYQQADALKRRGQFRLVKGGLADARV